MGFIAAWAWDFGRFAFYYRQFRLNGIGIEWVGVSISIRYRRRWSRDGRKSRPARTDVMESLTHYWQSIVAVVSSVFTRWCRQSAWGISMAVGYMRNDLRHCNPKRRARRQSSIKRCAVNEAPWPATAAADVRNALRGRLVSNRFIRSSREDMQHNALCVCVCLCVHVESSGAVSFSFRSVAVWHGDECRVVVV